MKVKKAKAYFHTNDKTQEVKLSEETLKQLEVMTPKMQNVMTNISGKRYIFGRVELEQLNALIALNSSLGLIKGYIVSKIKDKGFINVNKRVRLHRCGVDLLCEYAKDLQKEIALAGYELYEPQNNPL